MPLFAQQIFLFYGGIKMIRRSACLYEKRVIGIENICTQNNGKIEYIPSARKWLKELSHEKLLFCPCGCGNNLTLVAGKIRRPHFKIQDTPGAKKCLVVEESAVSVWSRIILKAWFDTKLRSDKIETRVPINRICDSNRKFEYSLYDFENKIGLCYWYDKSNIESIKVDVLERNVDVKRILYISDIHNSHSNYPDLKLMLKVQEKQGYLLYLSLNEEDEYEDAYLVIRAFVETYTGGWKQLTVKSDKLDSFNITYNGELIYQEQFINKFVKDAVEQYKADEIKRIEERKARDEEMRKQLEIRAAQAEMERQKRQQELEEQKEREKQAKIQKEAEAKVYAEEIDGYDFEQNETPIYDTRGNRLLKCTYCGKKATKKANFCYHDKKNINMGACWKCQDLRKKDVEMIKAKYKIPLIIEEGNCPNCNRKIIVRNTSHGQYKMCENYIDCGYREKIN